MYLGLCFDEKPTWTDHINYLSLHLAKYGAMLHQICEFVNELTLKCCITLSYIAVYSMEFQFWALQLKTNYMK